MESPLYQLVSGERLSTKELCGRKRVAEVVKEEKNEEKRERKKQD